MRAKLHRDLSPSQYAGQIDSVCLAILSLLLSMAVGCGGGEENSLQDALLERVESSFYEDSATVSSVHILETQAAGTKQVVKFTADVLFLNDLYEELSWEQAMEKRGWSHSHHKRYLKAVDKGDHKKRTDITQRSIYRKIAAEKEKRNISGTCLVEVNESTKKPHFYFSRMRITDLFEDNIRTLPKDQFSSTGVLLGTSEGDLLVSELIASEKAVLGLTVDLAIQLATEAQLLSEFSAPGKRWQGTIQSSGVTIPIKLTFYESLGTSQVVALIESPNDPLLRASCSGRLVEEEIWESGAATTKWQIELRVEETADRHHERWPIFRGRDFVLRVGDPTHLALINDKSESKLEPVASSEPFLSRQTLKQALTDSVKAGLQYKAPMQFGDEPRQDYLLTFVHVNHATGKVNAIVHPCRDPWNIRALEGDLRFDSLEGICWPLSLGYDNNFILQNGDLLGTIHETFVAFQDPVQLELPPSNPNKIAVESGIAWLGRIRHSDGPESNVRVTFAETSPDGAYLRVLLSHEEDPYSLAVYEGNARLDPMSIGDYAISVRKHPEGSMERQGSKRARFPDRIEMRVDPKGERIFGRSGRDMRFELSSTAKSASLMDLRSDKFAEQMESVLLAVAKWKGVVITKTSHLPIWAEIKSYSPVNHELELVMTPRYELDLQGESKPPAEVDSPRNAKEKEPDVFVSLKGSVFTQSNYINGAAVRLRVGDRKGSFFEEIKRPNELNLRLTLDGNCLVGFTDNSHIVALSETGDDLAQRFKIKRLNLEERKTLDSLRKVSLTLKETDSSENINQQLGHYVKNIRDIGRDKDNVRDTQRQLTVLRRQILLLPRSADAALPDECNKAVTLMRENGVVVAKALIEALRQYQRDQHDLANKSAQEARIKYHEWSTAHEIFAKHLNALEAGYW